jgi:hypothetical protein
MGRGKEWTVRLAELKSLKVDGKMDIWSKKLSF